MQVWETLKHLAGEGAWQVASIPRLFMPFEASLAAGEPHHLQVVVVPESAPAVPSTATPAEVGPIACNTSDK